MLQESVLSAFSEVILVKEMGAKTLSTDTCMLLYIHRQNIAYIYIVHFVQFIYLLEALLLILKLLEIY